MEATFRIGRIRGVPVGVHWSVLIIFGLIAWLLSAVRFPDAYPDEPAWAYAVAGLSAAVVFFAGLLAHEVSHAVVAQRNGIAVDSITLWLFGGVAQLHGEAEDPGAELRIAGVGPLVSLLLAVGFGGVAAVLWGAGDEGIVFGTFAWLAAINLLLAVFNVIPAAPLDGGRLLRAALWKWRGDRSWAVVVSARAGRVLGVVLIAYGFVGFFADGSVGALWLALIGWFLMGAASVEEQQAQVGDLLAGVRVADVMSPDPDTARPDVTVREFVDDYLPTHRHSTFPLVEDAQPVGLITLRRLKAVDPTRRSTTTLRDVACRTDELLITGPDVPLTELLPDLNQSRDRRALVVHEGRLVGIVSTTDVSRTIETESLRGQRQPR